VFEQRDREAAREANISLNSPTSSEELAAGAKPRRDIVHGGTGMSSAARQPHESALLDE